MDRSQLAVWPRVLFLAATVMALLATACGSTAPSNTIVGQAQAVVPPTEVPAPETPPAETAANNDASPTTAPADAEPAAAESSSDTAASSSGGGRQSVPVTLQTFLGFADSGAYAYEGTAEFLAEFTLCDAAPTHRMSAIDMLRSTEQRLVTFAAGPELAGDVLALDVRADERAVILWACLDRDGRDQHHLATFTIDDDGAAVDVSESTAIEIDPEQQSMRLLGWTDDGHVDVVVTLGEDDDYENWMQQPIVYDLDAGTSERREQYRLYDGNDGPSAQVTSPDGRFKLRSIEHPYDSIGCEGYGKAWSISIDDGTGERPAFDFDQPSFEGAEDIHFDDTGLVMWWGGCEGFYSAYVARLTDDGRLVDQHVVELPREAYLVDGVPALELVHSRLIGGGQAAMLLVDWSRDSSRSVQYRRVDFAHDPAFVSDRLDLIESATPLAPTLAGSGQLFAGDSLRPPDGATPGCGDQTLYATTTAGLVRMVGADVALDRVVDVAVSEIRETKYGDFTVRTRQIALLVECPERYIGGRVWYGTESEVPGHGIYLDRADVPSTTDIVELNEVQDEEYEYVWHTEATLVWREGTTTDVRFEPVPR